MLTYSKRGSTWLEATQSIMWIVSMSREGEPESIKGLYLHRHVQKGRVRKSQVSVQAMEPQALRMMEINRLAIVADVAQWA